jgi:hypothetical protein
MAGEPVRLALTIVADSAPVVEVPVPGADTVTVGGLDVPIVIDARDDYGLARLDLIHWLAGRRGTSSRTVRLPLVPGMPDRSLVPFRLDLADLGLEPGDTVQFLAQATDNSPSGRIGRSRVISLAIPTASEEREAGRQLSAATRQQLDSLVAASRRLERQAVDLAAERARPQGRGQGTLGFEEARRSEAVAKGQEDVLAQAEEIQEALRELEEAAERGALGDTAFARRLAELAEQLEKALSPELRERLRELQDALKALDPEAAREALQHLAEQQQQLREALERSRELFRRAALEGEIAALAEDAEELAREQRQWNSDLLRADALEAARSEEEMAARADSVASGLQESGGQVEDERASRELEEAAVSARRAAGKMRSAAASARQGQRSRGQNEGREAEQAMAQAGRQTVEGRDTQQEAWRQEVMRGLDRALAETARLSGQQLEVADDLRRGTGLAGAREDQAAVEEAVQKILDQIRDLGGRNALVSPQIVVALAVARRQMALAREAVSSGTPNPREGSERAGEAVDALNVAAFQMVRSRSDVEGAGSGSGLAEAMERMAQLARQQGQLSQQAGDLLLMAGDLALQQQLQALAARQRAVAQEMERMRAQGQIPGARDLAEEARDLARKLGAGQLDRATVERQERLFRRMLDAGRTLEGQDTDQQKERQSTSARDGEVRLPPALDHRAGERRLQFPDWDVLRRLSPEERRLVTEYFRRLTGGGAP